MGMSVLRIGIIGRIDKSLVDGQTIKTRVLFDELKKRLPDAQYYVADFSHYKKNPVKAFFDVISCMFKSEHIFVLLSSGGQKIVFPIVIFLNKFLHRHVYHDVIGGNLAQKAKTNKKLRKQLKSFDKNWVESRRMVSDLYALGIENGEYLPNFKSIHPLNVNDLSACSSEGPFRFCTLSRVSKEKGISDAIDAVANIDDLPVCLDIYGPVEEGYRVEFEQLLKQTENVEYKGVVDPTETVSVLKDYYALLFPSYWHGEGFPGTFIDSFNAGVPVIASRWGMNEELIIPGKTGYLIKPKDSQGLMSAVRASISNIDSWKKMKLVCLEAAREYSAENAMTIILEELYAKQ